jgi:hypothetical protein
LIYKLFIGVSKEHEEAEKAKEYLNKINQEYDHLLQRYHDSLDQLKEIQNSV